MNVASHLDTETELRDLRDHDQEDRAAIHERHLAAWLFILSIGALAICLWRHTFYRDEAQAFLIARDSHSLKELIENTRYEGHPPLWHVILFAVTRLGPYPGWMKVLNLLFFAAASAMLLFCRRLPVLFRSALPFTYFLFFEYGEISRNYLPGIVLLLAATLAMTQGKGLLKEVTIAAALGLAALTSLHAMVLSVAIAVIYGLWGLDERSRGASGDTARASMRVAVTAFVLVCSAVSAALIRPPADSGVPLGAAIQSGIFQTGAAAGKWFVEAYLPVPLVAANFWNKNYYESLPHHLGVGIDILGWGLFWLFGLFLFRSTARKVFVAGSAGLIAVMLMSPWTPMRHVGWLFICFVLAMLVQGDQMEWPLWKKATVAAVVVTNVFAGIFAAAVALKYPFSASEETADFLQREGLADAPMIFNSDANAAPVLLYLRRKDFYSVAEGRLESFAVWDRREFLNRHTPDRTELSAIARPGSATVLVTRKPLKPAELQRLGVRELAEFTSRIDPIDDAYYIYR